MQDTLDLAIGGYSGCPELQHSGHGPSCSYGTNAVILTTTPKLGGNPKLGLQLSGVSAAQLRPMRAGAEPQCSGLARLLSSLSLGSCGKTLAEYIWIGAGCDLHSRTKVLDFRPTSASQLPVWHFDDSSQSGVRQHRVCLRPCAVFPDPFREDGHLLVLCDTYQPARGGKEALAHPSNTRRPCAAVMEAASMSGPIFSVEQQYTLLDPGSSWPLGWPENATSELSSSFCAVGACSVRGRDFSSAHLAACVRAGLSISGVQAEHCPGQWSYRVGPCRGIDLADQLWLSRYILLRVSEVCGIVATLDPNPLPGDWAGASAPVRFSTWDTRQPGSGMSAISAQLTKLSCSHLHHMMLYGQRTSRRYSGQQKGGSAMVFSVGVDDKSAAICIPSNTANQQGGHYEDLRPASNMDPYLVTTMLAATTLGLPIPGAAEPQEGTGQTGSTSCAASSSQSGSRSSGALIDDIDKRSATLGPATPDGFAALAAHCQSSEVSSA